MAVKATKKVALKFWETRKAEYAANAYRKGATIKSLSEKYGVTHAAVSQALKVLGVATRPRGRQAKG